MILLHQQLRTLKTIFFLVFLSFSLKAYEPIPAVNDSIGMTPLCPFDHFLHADATGNIYIGVSEDNAATQLDLFSFSILYPDGSGFFPLISSRVHINLDKTQDHENPLYQKGIKHIALISKNDVNGMQSYVEAPVVVTHNEPNVIYLFESNKVDQRASLMKGAAVKDAFGREAGEIVALEAGGGYVFAAVSPKGGSFGDPGSALVVFLRGFIKIPDPTDPQDKMKERTMMTFTQIATTMFDASVTPMFRGSHVQLKWDEYHARLFVVVKSPHDAGFGLQSVFVGRFTNLNKQSKKEIRTRLLQESIKKFEKASERKKEEEILKKIEQVSGSKITRSTQEKEPEKSTAKIDPYPAFVLEPFVDTQLLQEYRNDNGSEDAFISGSIRDVSLLKTTSHLPYLILPFKQSKKEGTCFYAFPVTGGKIEEIKGCIASKKSNPVDVYKNWPKGKKSFGMRYIEKKAKTKDDFVFSGEPSTLIGGECFQAPVKQMFVRGEAVFVVTDHAIYFSQALLDTWGRIKGWTLWQKHFEVSDSVKIMKADLNQKTGNYILMIENQQGFYQVVKTQWKNDPLSVCFANQKGSVTTACLGEEGVTFLANDTEILEYNFMEGSAVQSINHPFGAISALAYINKKLCIATHNEVLLYDLQTRTYKKVSDVKKAIKLIFDEGLLYVLSRERLTRIDLSLPDNKESLLLVCENKNSLFGVLTDAVISGPLALVGSTKGLFSNKEGTSIRTVSEKNVATLWDRIEIPEGLLPVSKIIPVTHDRQPQSLTKGVGGHVYVVTTYQGKDQAHVNRFVINPVAHDSVVTNDTVIPFQDYYLQGIPSHFLDLCAMASNLLVDGANYFGVANFVGKTPLVWSIWDRVEPGIGIRFRGVKRFEVFKSEDRKDYILDVALVPGMGWIINTTKGLCFND